MQSRKIFEKSDSTELSEMPCFANAGASIVATHKGALKVMPSLNEITELMNGD